MVSNPIYIKISTYKLQRTFSQLTNKVSSENKETTLSRDFKIIIKRLMTMGTEINFQAFPAKADN